MATRQGKAFVGQQRLFNIRGGTDDEPITPVPPIPSEAVPSIPSSNNKTMAEPQAVQVYIAPVTTTKSLLGPNAVSPGIIRKVLPGFPWHLLPNWLTYIRCLAIPAMVALFYVPGRHVETSILFAVASFTDWLDGYLARRWDITSPFGAFLDPVADKLMVSTALILLSGRFGMHVVIPAAIILAREISVSALREWMAQRGLRDIVKVGFQGKLKTALTMMTLTLYLLVPESDSGTGLLSCVELPAKALLYLCAGITVTSGSVYFRAAAPVLLKAE
jgi:CDP-diacylglycerol--glycerol-3-phosphate 3-phosphatidyltransferase